MTPYQSRQWVVRWLLGSAAMVFIMVVIGGLTRLTKSGLSIVEWKPITGILPPLTAQDWQGLFEQYQHTPEFQQINFEMTVQEFKSIFWLEYWHRLWGRLTALFFMLPGVYYFIRGWIPSSYRLRILGILGLGVLEAFAGWYMVKSGLRNVPEVSHLRLALHFGIAICIYIGLVRTALELMGVGYYFGKVQRMRPRLRLLARVMTGLVCANLIYGALVAGLKAGLVYNTFPMMGGQWVPHEFWDMTPWYSNLWNNPATVQFIHRALGVSVLGAIIGVWYTARKEAGYATISRVTQGLLLLGLLQVLLGITTLLGGVPIILALLHQAMGLILLTACLVLLHRVREKQSF